MNARLAVARRSWDVVQSHERTLRQDVYRAGEGCHRAYLASEERGRARGLYHRIVLALERRVFARTPQIVAIADAGRREIETLYGVSPGRLAVVHNGVDLERFHPLNRARYREPARAEAAIPSRAFTVLFVGSGFARKGLATAVGAFAAALERFRERPDGDVAEAARRSAEPYTYAAQVSGFARIYSRCTRATYDFP